MRFSQYLQDSMSNMESDLLIMLEVAEFMDDNAINEGIGEWTKKIKSFLPKLGFEGEYEGQGLIQQLSRASKGVAQILWYALKAWKGDQKYQEKVKELSTSVKREDVVQFLWNLDLLTLHLFTGPIHMLGALTGWELKANITQATRTIKDRAKRAIEHLEAIAQESSGNIRKRLSNYATRLKKLLLDPIVA